MSRGEPIQIVIHRPTTLEGKASLAQQVASAHAEQIRRHVQGLACSTEQKRKLVDSILSVR